MADQQDLSTLKGDEKIVAEAKNRFKRCQEWEGMARQRWMEDYKFAHGDAYNGFQWPNEIQRDRQVSQKPCLTINKTRQHNLQIINDAKQNKPSVKVRPVGSGATFEAAEVFEGVVRHIEYISNAQVAYDTATAFQVHAGWGYWRVVTDYAYEDTFDQEIFIRRIKDPLSVYLDPDINEKDGSDAKFGFVFDDMPKEEFDKAYPKYKDIVTKQPLDNAYGWLDENHVRVAEYYRCVEKKDKLVALIMPDGSTEILRKSKIEKEIWDKVIEDPTTKARDIVENHIEWYLIIGSEIAERRPWPGKYIPIVRLIGDETIIEGQLDRKGHTRALVDPQRMYNYWSSSTVEQVALQGKSPYIAPAAAIENYEGYWNTANNVNHSVLPYNHVDDQGRDLAPPSRSMPPQMAMAYIQGLEITNREMMMVSGQYEANFGAKSNETSGKAINERQRQGDDATYHFVDNLGIAVRYTGKILIDLIPKIYDVERVVKILAEDGTESEVKLDPQAKAAYQEAQNVEAEEVSVIFNPNVGRYDVQADIGPAYATQRQEAFNAFSQIASQNPELMGVVGDLMFKNADFPGADDIAERLERMVPPMAKGEGVPPAVQELQGQLQNIQEVLAKTVQELAGERLKAKDKRSQAEVDQYKAITDRLDVIAKHFEVTPKDKSTMLHDLMKEEHRSELSANNMEMSNEEPASLSQAY